MYPLATKRALGHNQQVLPIYQRAGPREVPMERERRVDGARLHPVNKVAAVVQRQRAAVNGAGLVLWDRHVRHAPARQRESKRKRVCEPRQKIS